MAVNPVSLAESLRPWKQAGLHCLFFEDAEPFFLSSNLCENMPAQTLADSDSPQPKLARPQQPGANARQSGNALAAGIITSNPTSTKQVRAPESRMSAVAAEAAFVALPGPWQNMTRFLKIAPVLWTYAELGQDLLGQGDPQRSALLKHLISALAFPKGGSAFWPFSLPGLECVQHPDVFEQSPFFLGLCRIQPQVLIVLGPQGPEQCGMPFELKQPFTQTVFKGLLVLLLPEISALQNDEKILQQSIAFLRTTLTGLPLFLNH